MGTAAMLMDLLNKAVTVAMLSFVVSSMLAMGSGLTIRQIIEPLRDARLVLLALLANFVLMPLGALALAKVLWLDDPFAVGLLVLGCAAGAPFLPKLAELAKGNLAFSVGAMVLLMVVTVGYLPVVMPLLLPGVTVDPWNIARSLILLMLLPLAAGLALKVRYEGPSGEARARLDFQYQPHPAGIVDHRSEHRQGSTSLRHTRNPCGTSIYRIGLWDWLAARRF
jgi:BASS family bile acid:Na+ symporter